MVCLSARALVLAAKERCEGRSVERDVVLCSLWNLRHGCLDAGCRAARPEYNSYDPGGTSAKYVTLSSSVPNRRQSAFPLRDL